MNRIVKLPVNFQDSVPRRPAPGTYAFPTSRWTPEALDWRTEDGANGDGELQCAEQHVPGRRCGARMRLMRGVFVSELEVRDAHWMRVPLVDALAAPHFCSHQVAPEAYASALCAAQQACAEARCERPTPAALLDALLCDAGTLPPLAAHAARFPWCLPLARFVQQGQLRLRAADGAAFLARCGRELRAGPLAHVTGLLEADAPFVDVLEELIDAWLPPADDARTLSSGSAERSARDDAWLLGTDDAGAPFDTLRALVLAHEPWYAVSPQFVGLTLHCLRRLSIGSDAWPAVAPADADADGASALEALAAATVGRALEGELRVRAARQLLEGAERLVASAADWPNVALALRLLAARESSGAARPLQYALMAAAHALDDTFGLDVPGGGGSVHVFVARSDGHVPPRALRVLSQAADGRWRVRVETPPATRSVAWRHVADDKVHERRLFVELRERGADAAVRNALCVRDMRRVVQRDGWLNDECVSELVALFGDAPPLALAVHTHLSALAAGGQMDARKLRRRLQRWSVAESVGGSLAKVVAERRVQRVFVPWHMRNDHWALVVLELEAERVDVYDSLRGDK